MTRTTTSARRLGLWLGACVMVALFSLLLAGVARADSMRCGERIVATGEELHVVRALCGEPASARQRTEIRTERASADCGARAPGARCERDRWVRREVRIDEWTYDLGPRRLLQHLTFADGKLESIEAGGRGSQR